MTASTSDVYVGNDDRRTYPVHREPVPLRFAMLLATNNVLERPAGISRITACGQYIMVAHDTELKTIRLLLQ